MKPIRERYTDAECTEFVLEWRRGVPVEVLAKRMRCVHSTAAKCIKEWAVDIPVPSLIGADADAALATFAKRMTGWKIVAEKLGPPWTPKSARARAVELGYVIGREDNIVATKPVGMLPNVSSEALAKFMSARSVDVTKAEARRISARTMTLGKHIVGTPATPWPTSYNATATEMCASGASGGGVPGRVRVARAARKYTLPGVAPWAVGPT